MVSAAASATEAEPPGGEPPELVVISGMSGAGRSTAAKVLEDLGWFVVDNLPPSLIPTMVDLAARTQGSVPRIAVVVDVRGRSFFEHLHEALEQMDSGGLRHRIVFLESADDVLCAGSRTCAGRTRCRARAGSPTGSPASASCCASCAAR